LELFEKTKQLGIPVVPGGLRDQPFILMEEFGVVLHKMAAHKAFEEQNNQEKQNQLLRNLGQKQG
jgi:hypothetical protein